MDILSLGKASKVLRDIQATDNEVVASLAEGRFPTVNARLDWLEGQASKIKAVGSLQVDLSKGTFTGTELAGNKIQLKKIGSVLGKGSRDVAVGAITSSASYNALFDGKPETSVRLTTTNYSLSFTFGLKEKVTPHMISVTANRISSTGYITSFSIQAYDEDQKIWDVLVSDSSLMSDRNINMATSVMSKKYSLFKVSNSGRAGTDLNFYLYDIKIFAMEEQSTYMHQGAYETPMIDLGEGYHKTNLADIAKQIQTGNTDCLLEVSTSADGKTFSTYTALNPTAPPQGRYVKVKATLSALPIPGEVKTHQFDQAEANKVTLNEFTQADGDLKLITDYAPAVQAGEALGAGQFYSTAIQKSNFKRINTLEVK